MNKLRKLLQVVVAAGLLDVWLVRARKSTPYRGGKAKNIVEEFAVYGLPRWAVYVVGTAKVTAALGLLAGLRAERLVRPAAGAIVVLMTGAVAMHRKVGDPLKKTAPALTMLLLSSAIVATAKNRCIETGTQHG